ncbi:MAG TPA: RNA polymerase sigma factor [Blastocatellia bacterium]|nr:RNA polymerase sigma factor [Blastocatellia bacterium]
MISQSTESGVNTELLSDEQVVERVRSGETALFELIMRRYNRRLYRVTRSILRDDAEAEDVMQDAYVRAYVHIDQFDGRAKFATWLTKIAVNESLARLRYRSRMTEIDADSHSGESEMRLMSGAPGPEQEVLTRSLGALLEVAISNLPEIYQSVFMLREVEELSTAETADCLDITEETVKVRLHRARALLRKELYTRAGVATTSAFQFAGARCDRVVAGVLERLSRLE